MWTAVRTLANGNRQKTCEGMIPMDGKRRRHEIHWARRRRDPIGHRNAEESMLKTQITEQYGLKVPFINAGMAFIATAPLVRAVCSAGGMGMSGTAAMPPDALQAARRYQSDRPRVVRRQYHRAIQRDRAYRRVHRRKGTSRRLLLG